MAPNPSINSFSEASKFSLASRAFSTNSYSLNECIDSIDEAREKSPKSSEKPFGLSSFFPSNLSLSLEKSRLLLRVFFEELSERSPDQDNRDTDVFLLLELLHNE